MSNFGTTHYALEVARGNKNGVSSINKFGHAPDGLQTTATDIWDRADAGTTQQIWLAPTEARIHSIVSDAGLDSAGLTGSYQIQVYGLPDWDTAEVNEIVDITGTTSGATVNSYVIIYRMKVIPQSTTTTVGGNVGTITATALVDGTITAVILPDNGQTEMAIYGIPSTQSFYITRWSANIDKTGGAVASADFEIRVNENPDVQLLAFLRKQDISLQSTGNNISQTHFDNPLRIDGPAIIKIQGEASVNDLDGESSFDGYIVTN